MIEIQTGPVWKPVQSAQVQFAPLSSPMLTRARRAYAEALRKAVEASGQALDEHAVITVEIAEDAVAAFLRSITRDAVVGWEGLTVAGTAAPLPLTAEHIDAALADPDFGPDLSAAFALPAWERELEKNGLSPSRAGAIAGSKAKKRPARPSTGKGSATDAPAETTAFPTPIGEA